MEEEEEYETVKRNSLIRFNEEVEYEDLAPVFPELYRTFMNVADQYPEDSGEEYMEMLIDQNLKDLKKNQKPTGHNREARYRIIFPIDRERVEFYLYPRIAEEESEIEDVTGEISRLLESKGLGHEIIWDQMDYLKKKKE